VTCGRAPALLGALAALACGGDRTRSPTCGLAQVAGPALIQQQLTVVPAVLAEAPRGLPASLPARVVGAPQGTVQVAYGRGGLALTYAGPAVPAASVSDSTAYALLVVDDSTQRAQGVLIYESRRPPPTYPQIGTLAAGERTSIPVYGVRVSWVSVSNPRCPLLGPAPSGTGARAGAGAGAGAETPR
jgi:hypothetical protein